MLTSLTDMSCVIADAGVTDHFSSVLAAWASAAPCAGDGRDAAPAAASKDLCHHAGSLSPLHGSPTRASRAWVTGRDLMPPLLRCPVSAARPRRTRASPGWGSEGRKGCYRDRGAFEQRACEQRSERHRHRHSPDHEAGSTRGGAPATLPHSSAARGHLVDNAGDHVTAAYRHRNRPSPTAVL